MNDLSFRLACVSTSNKSVARNMRLLPGSIVAERFIFSTSICPVCRDSSKGFVDR